MLDSRERAGAADQPIAVLVQPLIDPRFGGVMFGIDPVSGRTDRRIVTAVRGGPEPLVSGEVDGSRYVLEAPSGKVLEFAANDGPELGRADLRRLVALSDQVASVFGGPQDVEWAIAADTQLWLLQSRPVTTEIRGVPRGPVYGPGPVAETFPEPLTELERDLWVPPLREAVAEAVLLAGRRHPGRCRRQRGRRLRRRARRHRPAPGGRDQAEARRSLHKLNPIAASRNAAWSLAGRAPARRRCLGSPSTSSTAPTPTSRPYPRSPT